MILINKRNFFFDNLSINMVFSEVKLEIYKYMFNDSGIFFVYKDLVVIFDNIEVKCFENKVLNNRDFEEV